MQTGWTYHNNDRIEAAIKAVAAAAGTGNVNIFYLANSEDEYKVLEKKDIPSIICSTSSFVDENVFKIDPLAKKLYRAIYDARLSPFKRHDLAAAVENLAHITYKPRNVNQDYIEKTRKLFADKMWLNDPFGPNYRHSLSPAEVAEYLNQAEVGLMLSAMEGANYASIQYLLCGLPVVSTRSIGGRDVFYDPDYVAIVNETPEAVTQGVERMRHINVSREEIRSRTLLKIKSHRDNLIRKCQGIYSEAGRDEDFSKQFHHVFKNIMGLYDFLTIQEFKELVK